MNFLRTVIPPGNPKIQIDLPESLQQQQLEVLVFPINSSANTKKSAQRKFGEGRGLATLSDDFNDSVDFLFDE